jgi:UDP-glucuronate decarboxylase
MIIAMTGSRSQIVRRPLPIDDPVQRCPDITEAKRVLDWQPKTALKEGLARTIDYFDKLLGASHDLEATAPSGSAVGVPH